MNIIFKNLTLACGICFNFSSIVFGNSSITRHFDRNSNNTGYSKKAPDDSVTKYYDRNSSYTGYSTTDKSGKIRFYDKKGNYTGYHSDK